jgi:predicted metalloendopeptidase
MGFAVSRLYIGKYFDDNARNQSKDIINNIRNSMIDLIQGADWMDADSKAKAVDKVIKVFSKES